MRKQAKAQFECAIKNNPADVEAYLGLAELHELDGQPAWAQRMYRQVLSLEPGNKLARQKLQGKRMGTAIGDLILRGKKR
jgi:hypothetical protein